ncbi:MAG: 5'/3'-nucleotidase SurE [Cyanobacteria bacterium P01_G01_bin.19]
MTIILTNDDGIDAPGIRALQQAVSGDTIIVAPNQQYSGCGHQVTTHKGIELKQRNKREYALDGSPADCTRLAINKIATSTKLVLSGINAGGNLGTDVYISGTVAAVREAAIHGIPGIAISHWIKRPLTIDWDIASRWTSRVIDDLLSRPLPPGSFWNVNLPHLEPEQPEPEIILCQPSIDPLPVDFRVEGNMYHYQGKYGDRDRTPGTDVDVCFGGNIAVTLIRL